MVQEGGAGEKIPGGATAPYFLRLWANECLCTNISVSCLKIQGVTPPFSADAHD